MGKPSTSTAREWLILAAGAATVAVGLARSKPELLAAGAGLLTWTAAARKGGGEEGEG